MTRGIVALMFLARVSGGEVSTSDETARIDWWTAEMVSQRMDPAFAMRMLDALRDEGTCVRAHDGVMVLTDLPSLPK